MIKITERYHLPRGFKEELLRTPVPWGFGALSEVVFYRTYSREKPDGTSETFPETIIRVVEAIGSIRKTFYRVMGVPWNQDYWDRMLQEMARRMLQLKLLPPGRGLWALGSTTVEEKGSMALYNCAYTNVVKLSRDLPWAMDALMLGVGVGFGIPYGYQFQLKKPDPDNVTVYEIPDTREGWCSALEMLLRSYELAGSATVKFDYSRIRPAGAKIRGFGGVASGPEPLAEMLEKVRERLDRYCNDQLDPVHGQHVTLLVADIANLIGKCVVSGNVRRSAEILLGSINDPALRDLKNADVYPERNDWQTGWSWLSNNSVRLGADEEFLQLDQIADGMIRNGEPGIVNLRNIREFGRYGRPKQDYALGINPCGEIPLEDKETCNLVEVFPTRHTDENDFLYTLQLATVFAHTVSLLPTHSKMTNEVVMRNHRIGVSLSGIWDWLSHTPVPVVIRRLRDGYKTVEWMMRFLAAEAGVRESVRLTTVKPSGTVSLLAGVSPGANPPHATRYLRRVTLSANSPIVERLLDAGIPVEPKIGDPRSVVATFPVELEGGRTRSVGDVPLDEHAAVVAMLQREWADNAVSNTMVVNERDVRRIAPVLGLYTPVLKSLTIMVNNDESEAYPQAPYEAVSKEKYDKLMRSIKPIDWSGYGGTDGQDTKYCDGEACAIDFSES